MILALLLSAFLITNSCGENSTETLVRTGCDKDGPCDVTTPGISSMSIASTVPGTILNTFCSRCFGNSVCLMNSDEKFSCVCPPDHEGAWCETSRSLSLNTCSENVCKNGGTCILLGNVTSCSCSLNYAGVDCSRAAILFRTALNITIANATISKVAGEKHLVTSGGFVTNDSLCAYLHEYLKGGNMSELAVLWSACQIVGIIDNKIENQEKDSNENQIKAILQLKFDTGIQNMSIRAVTIDQQLSLGSQKVLNLQQNGTIGLTGFKTEEVDYCAERYHDCSSFAACRRTETGYICTCRQLYLDISQNVNRQPGRICTFSAMGGWIVGLAVMIPFVIGAALIIRHLRHKERRRFWLSRTVMFDETQLIENHASMYRNDI